MTMDAETGQPPVPEAARAHARRLRELFNTDQQHAIALNAAHDHLRSGLEQLTSGLSAEALRAVYGPTGPDLGLSGRRPPVLESDQPIAALEDASHRITRGFGDYQRIADERRMVAADIGEETMRLVRALESIGLDEQQALQCNVDALAEGVLSTDPEWTR
jgi:hypothetical protein